MKIRLIIFCFSAGLVIAGCNSVRRDPGRVYMPDMGPSRAYETYAELDSNQFTSDISEVGHKIFYNHLPVAGTIAREEEMPFPFAKDAAGDTANYIASKQVTNPFTKMPYYLYPVPAYELANNAKIGAQNPGY